LSAGGQLEHPSEVNSSTRTLAFAGSAAGVGAVAIEVWSCIACEIQPPSDAVTAKKMDKMSDFIPLRYHAGARVYSTF
jgi:hypothetical protein